MRYFSVCSGVEAASLAWMPLGWEAFAFSELDAFPCAVLAERFPNVPNLGDMTKISIQTNGDITYEADAVIPNDGRAIDLIVGGTPCQDASVAGKRAGLVDGSRSKLAFTFTRLAYELAAYRGLRWIVWENVPGVFSLNGGRDFAAFLSSLAGRDVAPPEGGWGGYGVCTPATSGNFGCSWRVLDVQYVRVDGFPRAIPQRRRRIFLVGHIGDWRSAAEVLFEPSRMLGHTPPCRSPRKGLAANTQGSAGNAGQISNSNGGDVMPSITSDLTHHISHQQTDGGGYVIQKTAAFMGGQGAKARSLGYMNDVSPTIKSMPSGGNTIPDVVCYNPHDAQTARIYGEDGAFHSLNANEGGGMARDGVLCVHGSQTPISNTEHANAVNRNNGLENCVVSFEPGQAKRDGGDNRFAENVSSTIRADMGDNQTAVAILVNDQGGGERNTDGERRVFAYAAGGIKAP